MAEESIANVNAAKASSLGDISDATTQAINALDNAIGEVPLEDADDLRYTIAENATSPTIKAYAVGEYFYYGLTDDNKSDLCRVTKAIASGDTIYKTGANKNCESVTNGIANVVNEEVTDLKSALEADEALQTTQTKVAVSGWTSGRITSSALQTNSKYAYSGTYAFIGGESVSSGQKVYFDDTKYEIAFCYYSNENNDPTNGYDSISNYYSSSPATVPYARPYFRCMLKSANDITISGIDVYWYEAGEPNLLVGTVLEHDQSIDDLYEQIGKGTISPGTAEGGYYSNNNGVIAYTAKASSFAYAIDLTDYIGHVVNVKYTSMASGTSARITALCDAQGNISDYFSETAVARGDYSNGYNFYPTTTYYMLYISYGPNGSNLSVSDYSGLYSEIEKLKDVATPDVCYVDGSAVSTGNGSQSSPFQTIQEGIGFGSLVIKVRTEDGNGDAIEYGAFSVNGRNRPLTIMPASIPDYVSSTTFKDLPKVYIKDTNTYNGIDIRDCSDITLIDIWVDSSPRYNFNLQNIQHLEMVRCFASKNATAAFSTFRYVNVNGVIRDCKAWEAQQDGFNIHGFGDTQFINCVAYNCGDDGISHHDSCTGCIIGGEFYGNGKAGIASPYGGAMVDVSGAYCHNNTRYGLYADSDDSHPSIYARVSDCLFVDNAQADVYVADGTVVSWNTLYKTKSIQVTATFTEYNNTILP